MMTPATVLSHDGIEQPISEWALDYGITPAIIIGRLERGESIASAITTPMKVGHSGQKLPGRSIRPRRPVAKRNRSQRTYAHDGRRLTIPQWSDVTGVKIVTIRARLYAGWDIAAALSMPARHLKTDARPGVVSDFPPLEGTGAGAIPQAMAPKITFQGNEA